MAVQAALGSDIALAFDECTPYHADRDYTARSMERTHRWLDRCLAWHERQGRAARPCSGSSRAACTRTCGASGRARLGGGVDGLRSAGPWAATSRRCGRARNDHAASRRRGAAPPARDRRARRPGGGDRLGIDLFDCAVPTRLARHGMALALLPEKRLRFDVRRAAFAADEGPLVEGCPARPAPRTAAPTSTTSPGPRS